MNTASKTRSNGCTDRNGKAVCSVGKKTKAVDVSIIEDEVTMPEQDYSDEEAFLESIRPRKTVVKVKTPIVIIDDDSS